MFEGKEMDETQRMRNIVIKIGKEYRLGEIGSEREAVEIL